MDTQIFTFLSSMSKQVLEDYMVRKTPEQKEKFRAWLIEQLKSIGYDPKLESGRYLFKYDNVLAGDPDKARLLLTAHYDTCPVLPFPNMAVPEKPWLFTLRQLFLLLIFSSLTAGAAGGSKILFRKKQIAGGVSLILAYFAGFTFVMSWMLNGKANKHTVNDNSSGVITLLEVAQALPEELRERVCFVFFDDEEKGLLGSKAFSKKHKDAKKNTLMLNLDCVSDGNYIKLFPSKKLMADASAYPCVLKALRESFKSSGEKIFEVFDGKSTYSSDQRNFDRSVAVCALSKGKIGYYFDKIHTKYDRVMQEENIRLLRDNIIHFLRGSSPAQKSSAAKPEAEAHN